MNGRTQSAIFGALLVVGIARAAAAADYDKVKPSVSVPVGNPTPLIRNNGVVPGTIQLIYTVNANTFTAGSFGNFHIDLSIQPGATTANYSTNLDLDQNGSTNLDLTIVPDNFTVTGRSWTAGVDVNISIPADVPGNPSLNTDGYTLVGNIGMSSAGQRHLQTPTNIQVQIVLVHPSSQCLRLYDFIVNNDTGDIITSATYTVSHGPNPKINGTQPGGLLDAILLANTCSETESFDVLATLDKSFWTKPHANPGNAVFTYSTSGIIDPSTFNVSAFGTGAGQQQNLCLSGLSLAAGQSFLMTVGVQVADDIPPPLSSATFTGAVSVANTSCSQSQLNLLVTPNPAGATLRLSQQQQ